MNTIKISCRMTLENESREDGNVFSLIREGCTREDIVGDIPRCYGDDTVEELLQVPLITRGGNGRPPYYDAYSYRDKRSAIWLRHVRSLSCESALKILNAIQPDSLRSAVAAIVWWDVFASMETKDYDRLRAKNKSFDRFCTVATDPSNGNSIDRWLGTPKFAESLARFGYFLEMAVGRTQSHAGAREIVHQRSVFHQVERLVEGAQESKKTAVAEARKMVDAARAKAKDIVIKAKDRAAAICERERKSQQMKAAADARKAETKGRKGGSK